MNSFVGPGDGAGEMPGGHLRNIYSPAPTLVGN